MRILTLISCCSSVLLFCLTCKVSSKIESQNAYKIKLIDTETLSNYYYLRLTKKGEEIILLSEKHSLNLNIDNCKLKRGKKYFFNLEKMSTVILDDSTTWRLYRYDFSLGDDLRFPKKMGVYKAHNMKGLCLSNL